MVENEQEARTWRAVAERLSGTFEVRIQTLPAGELRSGEARALWIADGSEAGLELCDALAADPARSPVGIVFVCAVPSVATNLHGVPVLVLRGRQSETLSHADAVAGYESLPIGRLIELENCADAPESEQPLALATAIVWFFESLEETSAEASTFGNS
ncbi:MAG TPA: hypothetical protein VKA63_06985 [Candidatus Krumholzibacteria bacterium]|nr:hypothetical protein [Candidatus Krumholzibacteria bacterium]